MSKAKTLATTVSTGGVLENPANVLVDSDIGVSVQAYDADLTSWAAIAPSAKQDTLVSGTSLKSINGTSLLGSGDLSVVTSPAGSTGQVQYNNAGAFGALADGTSGQVLTSAGTGAAPTWVTPAGGAGAFVAFGTTGGF